MPVYMVLLFIYYGGYQYSGNGPFYAHRGQNDGANCEYNWWTNMLLIMNLVNREDQVITMYFQSICRGKTTSLRTLNNGLYFHCRFSVHGLYVVHVITVAAASSFPGCPHPFINVSVLYLITFNLLSLLYHYINWDLLAENP